MVQEFKTIKTDKGYVAVGKAEEGIHPEVNYFDDKVDFFGFVKMQDFLSKEYNWFFVNGIKENNRTVYKILATNTSFKLDGIDQFELEDEIKSMAFDAAFNSNINNNNLVLAATSWYDGYKAAQSKGCYTEEQAVDLMRWVVDNYDKTPMYMDVLRSKVQSLNQPKTLASIEVEMEQYFIDGKNPYIGEFIPFCKPKLTNGSLTVVKYNYAK